VQAVVEAIAHSPVYQAALLFFALYPLLSSIMWMVTSLLFYLRRERHPDERFYDLSDAQSPLVSVIVPSYREELTACGTLDAVVELDYPRLEIFVVDDGSPDGTLPRARSFLRDPRVTVVRKNVNEGKALALNDVLPLTSGRYVLVLDGDSKPHADVLRWMVPHMARNPWVGAVTGHPVVRNRQHLLGKIQAVEFASIVSLLKRAQVVWGQVMTVSGVMTLWRRSALERVGLFVHDAATEDISTSWSLQRASYQIRYEPRAMIDMQVPPTLRGLWRQRRRWAKGLAQVLARNAGIWAHWRSRGLFPVYAEALLSIIWAYCFVVLTAMWLITWIAGLPLLGATPVPAWWGMLIATASLLQLGLGVLMDRRYQLWLTRTYVWAALYPVIYWVQMAVITVIATPAGLLRPHSGGRWQTPRAAG
jgi:biofilm PGA synthesis N-glycosyltransferase PgaC